MTRELGCLFEYCESLAKANGQEIRTGMVLAKFLTANDDSGRHGVLIPSEAYGHFPELSIEDTSVNSTRGFYAFDVISGELKEIAYKYYQRYPERRITRLNSVFNDKENGIRFGLFISVVHKDGSTGYYVDCVRESIDKDFKQLVNLVIGCDLGIKEGVFVLRAVDAPVFVQDSILSEFLNKFDQIHSMGWVNSLRTGSTGIGYTFEALMGIKENNDRRADYNGIEIKCKQIKRISTSGKINLFQQAPKWENNEKSINLLRRIGKLNDDGLYTCNSQITTSANNLQLMLRTNAEEHKIELLKALERLGHWPYGLLENRLQEKHSRSVFVKADVKNLPKGQKYLYNEVLYCERPSIEKFVSLVEARQLVFELIMHELDGGRVRNHGYPWRLVNEDFLSDLFSLQVKVR